MRVLILGATGRLARLTATWLTERQPDIVLRLASHRERGCSTLREAFPQADIVLADWYQEASLAGALDQVDKVVMITPDGSDERVATSNVIKAALGYGRLTQLIRLIASPPGLTINDLTKEQLATRTGATLTVIAKPLLDASGLPVTYVNVPCWIMFNLRWLVSRDKAGHLRIEMPSVSDYPRLWMSETDIAEVFATLLAGNAKRQIGQEYVLTGESRYTYAELAAVLSEALGQPVAYVDSDAGLRESRGEDFGAFMTYLSHEVPAYTAVPMTRTVEKLLAHPPLGLREYVNRNRHWFA